MFHLARYPDKQQAIVAGKSTGTLERNVLPALEHWARLLGLPFRHYSTKNRIDLGQHSLHLFAGTDVDAQDYVQGMTAAAFFADEYALLHPDFFWQARARLSVPGAKAFLTCNPVSPRSWAKTDVIDRIEAGSLDGVTMTSLLRENRHLPDAVHTGLENSFFGHYRERMIEARWVSPSGLVYNSVPWGSEQPPALVAYDLAIDYGTANATAALLLGRDATGNWHCFDEYYWPGRDLGYRSDDEHANAIASMCEGLPLERVVVDPTAASLKVALRKRNLPVRNASQQFTEGQQALQGCFSRQKLIVYPATCPRTAAELEGLFWDERAMERSQDKPTRGNDHSTDALRYWAMNRYPPRFTMQPVAKPRGF